jgi:hypothetical protein
MSRPAASCSTIGALAFIILTIAPGPVRAQSASAQAAATPQTSPSSSRWTFTARDTLRLETWRFFDPEPGGGEPDYTFLGNRLFVQAAYASPRFDVTLAAQHVGFAGLPAGSFGPGALGTGPLYFAQGGQHENIQRPYPKYVNVRLKRLLPGLDVQVGRQSYASGAEAATREPKIEAVRRQRMDARLIGEFEWSLYQRSFDGVRMDWSRESVAATGVWFMPTQGGFAKHAEKTMTDIRVYGAALSLLPSSSLPHTTVQAFVWRYDDSRDVTGRPDNTGRTAAAADVGVTSVGGAAMGAYPSATGQWDVLGWLALQTGRWYDHDHGAVAFAAEAGHQWTGTPWSPWLRAGFTHASGDADAGDDEHGTFFPMLPTMRRFSQTTVNSTMNLDDLFVLAVLRPTAALNLRVDWHRLALADAADRWYSGSGATLSTGGNFGYVTRPSNGSTDFGSSLEVSAAYTVNRYWSVNGFVGRMWGGPVVTATFAGDRLWFVYVENGIALSR